ncbi:hypothetical protein L1887_18444 [Cichorium endivia]|nr:hypothetical protein L1887_18444 [Cichorium endivia]
MVTAASVGVAVKTLLTILFCVMVAGFAYVFAIDGFISCFDLGARWGGLGRLVWPYRSGGTKTTVGTSGGSTWLLPWSDRSDP